MFVELPEHDDSFDIAAEVYPGFTERGAPTNTKRASLNDIRRVRAGTGSCEPFGTVHRSYIAADGASSASFAFKYRQSVHGPHLDRVTLIDGRSISFDDFCAENAASGHTSARAWAAEWRRAWSMPCATLSAEGTRLQRLNIIANDFAAFAGAVATKIVEEKALPLSQRGIRAVPKFDHVFVHAGCSFVVATAPPFSDLYGSRAAAYRAARNEVRAMRMLLSSTHIPVMPPLCACATYLGVTIFASVPLPYFGQGAALVHGALGCHDEFSVNPVGQLYAHALGEFIPLMPHSFVPDGPQTQLPWDLKLFHHSPSATTFVLDAARLCPPAVCAAEYSRYPTREDQLAERNKCRHPIEEIPRSYLSALFRPEFLHRTCQLQLNTDAATPHQLSLAQENIGYSIALLHTRCMPAVRNELLSRWASKTLVPKDISKIFHREGVNMRYLGRICNDIVHGMTKHNQREGLVAMLEREMVARTWKSIVYDQLHDADHRTGQSDSIIIANLKNLLHSTPESGMFWDLQMKPTMEEKFGYTCHPVVTPSQVLERELAAHATGNSTARVMKDPSQLQVYHCINSSKKRVEALHCPLNWVESGPGQMTIEAADESVTEEDGEGAHAALFPLIGITAKANAALLFRSLELIGVEMNSDMRGKKVFVHATPVITVSNLQSLNDIADHLVANSPPDVHGVLSLTEEPHSLCESLMSVAEAEAAQFSSIAESDPRVIPTLRYQALCAAKLGDSARAYSLVTRWFDLRRPVQKMIVAGSAMMECGMLFCVLQRPDRAEAAFFDGITALRTAFDEKMEHEFVATWLLKAAHALAAEVIAGRLSLSAERIAHLLDYYDFACSVLETSQSATTPQLLWNLAQIRQALAPHLKCSTCHKLAVTVSYAEVDDDPADAASTHGLGRTIGAASNSATTRDSKKHNQPAAGGTGAGRRRRDDPAAGGGTAARNANNREDDPSRGVGDIFIRNVLPAVAAWIKGDASSGADIARAKLLRGVASGRSLFSRATTYHCETCGVSRAGEEAVLTDIARVLTRAGAILQAEARRGLQRPDGDALSGQVLVALGSLQGNAALITSGIADLSRVHGDFCRPVIEANIALADVLYARSVVLHPSIGGHKRDMSRLQNCEEVLHAALTSILKRDAAQTFPSELQRIVGLYLAVLVAYGDLPAAKREHGGVHTMITMLSASLPDGHPLLGRGYDHVTKYYLKLASLSKDKEQSVQRTTALSTAAAFGVKWLHCAVVSGDVANVETILHTVRDDIIRALRSSPSLADRNAATRMATECRSVINSNAAVRNHPTIVASLGLIDDVFKAQPKVVEETAQSAQLLAEVKALRGTILDAASKIRQHSDRSDAYCKSQMARIHHCKTRALEIQSLVRDTDCIAKAAAVIRLHDDVTGASAKKTDGDSADVDTAAQVQQVVYESPYASLPSGYSHEDMSLPSGFFAPAATPNHGRPTHVVLGSHPNAADLAKKSRPAAQQLKRAFAQLALSSSRKSFDKQLL